MPRNTEDIEQHKGDNTLDIEDEDVRDTIPDQLAMQREEDEDDDEVDDVVDIDLDALPEFEGPDA